MNSISDRFEAKVAKSDGCWLWLASKTEYGYGRFRNGANKVLAHRFSYEQYKGPIPKGLMLLHSCDNPACVNPEHLRPGTAADNMQDKCDKNRQARGEQITKGRDYKGEKHPSARLSEQQAAAILKDTRPHHVIAKEYGVTRGAISHLKRGFTWPHLTK